MVGDEIGTLVYYFLAYVGGLLVLQRLVFGFGQLDVVSLHDEYDVQLY